MDCQDYIPVPAERKKGQHLQREERGAIQHLKRQGYSNRAIAREIGCSPSTVANELRRGTPPRKSNQGRKPGYSARRGEAVYKANRKLSRRRHRICRCARFLRWVARQFKEHKWSLDACVGYARLHRLFPADEMVCTHTLYNEVWAGNLDLSVTELPEDRPENAVARMDYTYNERAIGQAWLLTTRDPSEEAAGPATPSVPDSQDPGPETAGEGIFSRLPGNIFLIGGTILLAGVILGMILIWRRIQDKKEEERMRIRRERRRQRLAEIGCSEEEFARLLEERKKGNRT